MNKKILFGTTALVAAGFVAADVAEAADPLRLEIRGYRNEFFSFGDIDAEGPVTDYNSTGHFSDGEVQFRGVTTLDNGISVGVQVELEAFSGGDQIDENYAFLEGGFGRLVLGSENSGTYNTFWSVTAPYVGAPINSGWITVFIPRPATSAGGTFTNPMLSTNLDISNDDNGVSYYTPRFAGFQLTASYFPTATKDGDGKNFPAEADEDTEYHDAFAVGLHYTNSFGGFDVSAAGAWGMSQRPEGAPWDTIEALGDYGNQEFVKAGLVVGYGGFSLGGSFGYEYEGRITGATTTSTSVFAPLGGAFSDVAHSVEITPATSSKGFSYDVGLSYSNGPWAVGATYFHGEAEGTIFNNEIADPHGGADMMVGSKDEDEVDAINVGVSYTLGPGISANAGVMWASWDTENDVYAVAGGGTPGEDAHGVVQLTDAEDDTDTDGVVGYVGLKIGY